MKNLLSRIGAKLGNWNDERSSHDSRREATRRYRALDRFCSVLHTLPDRPF